MKRESLSLVKIVVMGMLLGAGLAGTPVQAAGSGVVQFGGMIVEDGCQFKIVNNQVYSECYRDGKAQTATHSVEQVQQGAMALPAQVGESHLSWLDNAHAQALITVSYR
ncbi:hypothetical protein AAGU66_11170 [Edwardsiella ictaluri]|uniref:Type 1 fimbrial protein n=2 Tax=Edwardsiella ictaluri TaxID=67780 RepID=C5BG31_EDWI9|nr:hypothetical protein [Edwardsiella ictaluri]ACR69754.1 hypothetical protein NT01EI_2585 [Edwardsiella ictaluri 93-146]UCQ46751.1 hypothetical protein DB741_11820 [Edwardsiella ictaluri]UCQ50016.1 hypothetical protein DB731_11800 [Edwardsiella ictaluri]UYB60694.1 hypothetical protein N8I66_11670 [Edwardsiella ictaluri]UYB63922.1 hypothetical protein N8I67_11665 [Edwardsiella ictaluri]